MMGRIKSALITSAPVRIVEAVASLNGDAAIKTWTLIP